MTAIENTIYIVADTTLQQYKRGMQRQKQICHAQTPFV